MIQEENEHSILKNNTVSLLLNDVCNDEVEVMEPIEKKRDVLEEPKLVISGHTRSGRPVYSKEKPKPVPVKKTAKVEWIEDDPLCTFCGQLEDSAISDLILCDGPCRRGFHMGCLGFDTVPSQEKWYCQDCLSKEYDCFICGTTGPYLARGGVFKCHSDKCGKFYHLECVWKDRKTRPVQTMRHFPFPETQDELDRDFKCPLHSCSACSTRISNRSMSLSCLLCPRAFHSRCIAPGCRFNVIGMICMAHPDAELPIVPDHFDAEEDQDYKIETRGADRTFSIASILDVPAQEFFLPDEIFNAVQNNAPAFRKIQRNIYTFKLNISKDEFSEYSMCVCKKSCKDNCINQLSYLECVGPGVNDVGEGKQKRSMMQNCRIGTNCGNRALQSRKYAPSKPMQYRNKGWGLELQKKVKAGELIHEYVGEVITQKMMDQRMEEHKEKFPHDKNMYVMHLDSDQYIDARYMSNTSRFINHSCEPNCRLQKWWVGDRNRIAIVAIRDIKAFEELTYDYQFDTSNASDFICCCGSKTCRGTLAPKPLKKTPDVSRQKVKSKAQIRKDKRILEKREEKKHREKLRRLSLTSTSLPGEPNVAIRFGPTNRDADFARDHGIFLPRTANMGYNFMERQRKWIKRHETRAL